MVNITLCQGMTCDGKHPIWSPSTPVQQTLSFFHHQHFPPKIRRGLNLSADVFPLTPRFFNPIRIPWSVLGEIRWNKGAKKRLPLQYWAPVSLYARWIGMKMCSCQFPASLFILGEFANRRLSQQSLSVVICSLSLRDLSSIYNQVLRIYSPNILVGIKRWMNTMLL